MAVGKNRRKQLEEKKLRKQRNMLKPGNESQYARKARYCFEHNVWGFDVPEPKPWK